MVLRVGELALTATETSAVIAEALVQSALNKSPRLVVGSFSDANTDDDDDLFALPLENNEKEEDEAADEGETNLGQKCPRRNVFRQEKKVSQFKNVSSIQVSHQISVPGE